MNTGIPCCIPPVISKRLILPSALTALRSVYPPLILYSTVPDLSPLPVTRLISDTDPVSLNNALESGVCQTTVSVLVPVVSNSTVRSGVSAMNFSVALPDTVTVSPTPNTVL